MKNRFNIQALIALLGIALLLSVTWMAIINPVFIKRLANEPLLRIFSNQQYEPFANHLVINWVGDSHDRSFGYIRTEEPVVEVEASAAPCFVFLVVESDGGLIKGRGLKVASFHNQLIGNGWTRVRINGNLTGRITSYYVLSISPSYKKQYLSTFKAMSVFNNAGALIRTNAPLSVEAYSVQQNGFATAFDAWESTFG